MAQTKNVNLKAVVSLSDRFSKPMKGLNGQIQRFGKNLKTLNRAAAGVGRSFSSLGRKVIAPVTLLTGALGYSLSSAARNFAQFADSLSAVSQKSGVAIKELQLLRYAASMNGASAEAMDTSLVQLNKTLYEAASGKNKEAAALFKKLGISLRDANGNIRKSSELMPELAQAFKLNTDQALRTKMAMTLFGKSGTALLPLLSMGSDGLKAMSKRANELGLVLSEDAVIAGGEMNNALSEVSQALNVATGEIIKAALPAVKQISEAFMVWLKANREFVSVKVSEAIRTIGTAIQSINWDLVLNFIKYVVGIGIAAKILNVAKACLVLAKAFKAIALSNPFTAIALAVTTLGFLIYDNWKSIKKFVSDLQKLVPEWIKNLISGGNKATYKVDVTGTQNEDFDPVSVSDTSLSKSNKDALAMSATGKVSGSVDVNIHDEKTGKTTTQTAPLSGGVHVSGNPGYRDLAYGD